MKAWVNILSYEWLVKFRQAEIVFSSLRSIIEGTKQRLQLARSAFISKELELESLKILW